jgi:hypothetical protein
MKYTASVPTQAAPFSLLERAANYINKMPRSVAGEHGHDAALRAAVVLVKDFALSEAEALPILGGWNILCSPMWSDAELRHKIKQATLPHPRDVACPPGRFRNSVPPRLKGLMRMVSATPQPSAPLPLPVPRPKFNYDAGALASFAAKCDTTITPELLREVSFVDLPPESEREATARAFLERTFSPGERVILFDDFKSQGSHLYIAGTGCFRLSKTPGEQSMPGRLPLVGPQGVWYLANPVDGEWRPNDSQKLSRRSHQNVTAWHHLILESDTAPAALWLRALVQLPFPVVAIYTSGGKSVHAVLRVDAASKAELDEAIAALKPVVCPIGADPAALTAVRLSRLPGALRCGTEDGEGTFHPYDEPRLQRLLWLSDGTTGFKSIIDHLRPF